jgi:hypothetical protein
LSNNAWLGKIEKNMRNILLLLAAVAIIATFIIINPTRTLPFSRGWKMEQAYHKPLYKDAIDVWKAGLATTLFHPQTLLETKIGSSTTISFAWKKPSKIYNHFLITVTDPITQWTRTEAGEHERVTLDASGLNPDREYIAVVQACVDPDCRAWFIADKEVNGKTSLEYWQIGSALSTFDDLRTVKDHQETLRHPKKKTLQIEMDREGWQTSVLKHRVQWVWENNIPLTDEEINRLEIDRVVSEGDSSRQRLEFHIGDKTGFAILLNP